MTLAKTSQRSAPRLAPPEIVEFLYYEAMLLDERRFEEWMDLFTEDGYLWVPLVGEAHERGSQISLMNDDRELMETRVRRLRHPMIHSQTPPARAARLVTNVLVEDSADGSGEILVYSCYLMVEARLGQQRVASGRCEHRLRREGEQWRIAGKTVRLVNSDAAFTNVALPF